jgi:hypothetical protein
MFSCLLKRVLPFALTFAVGATLGWLFNFNGMGGRFAEFTTRLESHPAPFAYGYGHSCRMYRRDLVAETKPLLIRFVPDARWPRQLRDAGKKDVGSLWAHVTFGADGKVQNVRLTGDSASRLGMDGMVGANETTEFIMISRAVERAARQIQFEPETVNSVPITVTKDVEIYFMAD